jgi:hypothetical protein
MYIHLSHFMILTFHAGTAVNAISLSENDLTLLCQFAMKTKHGLTHEFWEDLPLVFENETIKTLWYICTRVKFLSGLDRTLYDCCRMSCCCFIGPFANSQQCLYCKLDRNRPNGTLYKTFSYIPLIPQLSALFSSEEQVETMQYRARYFEPSNDPACDGQAE